MSVALSAGSTVAPQGRPLGTIALMLLAIAGLAALDQFLARTEQNEVRGAALRSWEQGTQLLRQGHAAEALDALRNAHTLVLDNVAYELDMIPALMALGRTAEADPLMDDVLQREPNDGAANLMAGRLMVKEGRARDAVAYYHRAIYGEWPGDALVHRVDARFELIQYLAGQGSGRQSGQELLAELISLEAEPDRDESRQRRIAQFFLQAGAPNRAAGVYQGLVARDPNDAANYEGLGEADMEQGDYRGARSAFMQAAQRQPDKYIEHRLELLDEVIGIDPTPRRLPMAEKYQRSLRILELARVDLEGLLAQRPSAATSETANLLKAAGDVAASTVPGQVTNEQAEQNLDLASRIWKLRIAIFGTPAAGQEEELRLIMQRIGP
jgi:tetratricopeptide (TPR) repeat protein